MDKKEDLVVNVGEAHVLWPIILKDDPELAREIEGIIGSDESKEYYVGLRNGMGFILEYVERELNVSLLDERRVTALLSCISNKLINPLADVPGYG